MANKYNKVSDSFVCPYCLSESKLKRIQFRSTNPKLQNKVDSKKTAFWSQLLNKNFRITAGLDITPRIRGVGLKTIRNKAGKSVPVLYYDEGLYPTDTRLCPDCHNDLPQNIGFVNTANVIVIGEDSEASYEYVKRMFRSLSKNCSISNVSFYLPDSVTQKAMESNAEFEKLNYKTHRYLVGKAVYSLVDKTDCEITITYYPLGLGDVDNIENIRFRNILQNANALLFVTDYDNVLDSIDQFSTDSPYQRYLFDLDNVLKKTTSADEGAPVALVLTNREKLEEHEEVGAVNLNSFNSYENEVERLQTTTLIQNINNDFYQGFKAVFTNACLFSASVDDSKKESLYESYQNPLQWIISTMDIVKETKEEAETNMEKGE